MSQERVLSILEREIILISRVMKITPSATTVEYYRQVPDGSSSLYPYRSVDDAAQWTVPLHLDPSVVQGQRVQVEVFERRRLSDPLPPLGFHSAPPSSPIHRLTLLTGTYASLVYEYRSSSSSPFSED